MPKTKKTTHRKPSWRDYPESAIRSFLTQPNPESLHPGPGTVLRAMAGGPEARAIIDAYAFRSPVTTMTREQLEAI